MEQRDSISYKTINCVPSLIIEERVTINILTRYLYDKTKVEISLKNAIQKHYYQESNFWAYELYFSGFKSTVVDILNEIYTTKFSINHPKLGRYIEIKKKKSKDDPELIATIIKNLTMKNPEIKENEGVKFVNVKRYHIEPFMTKEPHDLPLKTSWKFLRQVCRYRVLGNVVKEDILHYVYNWLNLAAKSPIWFERIIEYKGEIKNNKVVFYNEDYEEDFYDRFGYEPDEQPLEIQMNCIGK